MKNGQQIATVHNNLCSSCIFNDDSKDILDSCEAGILSNLQYAKNPTGFCLLHRPNDIDLEGRTKEEFLENAKKVSSNKYGIILFDESDNNQDITKTIDSIISCEYPKNRIKVVLSIEEKTLLDRKSDIGEYLKHYYYLGENDILAELTFHKPDMPAMIMETEVFQKIVDATHFININAGNTIDKNMLQYVQDKRSGMEKIIVCRDEDQDVTCLPKSVAQNFYFNYNNYRNMVRDLVDEAINTDTYFKYEKSE